MPVPDAVVQDMFTGIDLTGVLANAVLATATGAALTLLARWRGWELPEARVWQPSPAWPRAARLHRARDGETHDGPTSDPAE